MTKNRGNKEKTNRRKSQGRGAVERRIARSTSQHSILVTLDLTTQIKFVTP